MTACHNPGIISGMKITIKKGGKKEYLGCDTWRRGFLRGWHLKREWCVGSFWRFGFVMMCFDHLKWGWTIVLTGAITLQLTLRSLSFSLSLSLALSLSPPYPFPTLDDTQTDVDKWGDQVFGECSCRLFAQSEPLPIFTYHYFPLQYSWSSVWWVKPWVKEGILW